MATSYPLTLRLKEEFNTPLAELAASRGLSRGEMARQILIAFLQDSNHLEIRASINDVHGSVESLRSDVATALEMMLLNFAEVPTDEVRDFISEHFRSKKA